MYAYQWVCFWDFLLKFSGDMYEIGAESGRHYSVNVPLKEGIDDQSKYVYMSIRGCIIQGHSIKKIVHHCIWCNQDSLLLYFGGKGGGGL